MTRLLIEGATGFHTDSVYTDLSLVGVLPGERLCGPSVVAIKAHPQWHPFTSIENGRGGGRIRPAVANEPPDAKPVCECAGNFSRAVAVVRDPFATFLAEYKRLRTHDYSSCSLGLAEEGQVCHGGHVASVTRSDFDRTDFRREVLRLADEWSRMFDDYDAFAAAHPGGLHLATFEALTGPDASAALAGLVAALGAPPAGAERLRCAFEMARHPAVYRPKHPASVDASFAYGSGDGSSSGLVCEIWRVVGQRAAQHGYEPWGGAEC
ncbi:hypothetical protein HT031_006472 [Scenedesmus sp. PABB004]|nr:hypothetical protein HT031_006472 [Scenedesmus sp. PABB004]